MPDLIPFPRSAQEVLCLIEDGSTLHMACDLIGIKPTTIQALARDNPDFRLAYQFAREALADYYAHKLACLADNEHLTGQQVSSLGGIYKWLAACNNRARYSDKLTLEIEHKVPIAAALADARARVIDSTAKRVPMPTTRTAGDNSHTVHNDSAQAVPATTQVLDLLTHSTDCESVDLELADLLL